MDILLNKFTLPKEFTEKWLLALRSGEYHQGRAELYDQSSDRYCCLGVAGYICGISKDILKKYGFLSKDILGVDFVPIQLIGEEENELARILSTMNDGIDNNEKQKDLKNYNFNQIADWIEANVQFI